VGGVVALSLALTTLAFPTKAWAAARLAFVNLARDSAAGQRAIERLRPRVTRLAHMSAMARGPSRQALEGELQVGAASLAAVAQAQALIEGAKADLHPSFDTGAALDKLARGEHVLLGVVPTPLVIDAIYRLEVVRAEAYAARSDDASASAAFARARLWKPQLTALDPARFQPRLVQLYRAAGVVPPGKGSLGVVSDPAGGTLWVDGKTFGVTPVQIELPVGEHTIAVTLNGHEPRAERVTIVDGKEIDLDMLLSRLPAEQRALDLREGLITGSGTAGPSDGAITAVAEDLADLAAADVLILVRDGEHGLEAASWENRTKSLSGWVPADDGTSVARTIPGVLDPRIIVDPRPQPPQPPPPPRWYRRWWGTSLLVAAGLGVLATSAYLIFGERGTTPNALVTGKDQAPWLGQ
jgi:hypothetical protein